ncbi:hypothetical protein IVB31_09630 [Bradyrhizobium sp. 21]|nr:hypothetical protein [Bradyrhizobium sp. 21]MCK1384521.1 hypothetical protein [Bradyrhizobium sp. 21]
MWSCSVPEPTRPVLRSLHVLSAALVAAISIASSPAGAQNAHPLDERILLGVGTHQGLGGPIGGRGYVPSIAVKQLKDLGVTSFRDDFPWSDFEIPGRAFGFNPQLGRLEAQVKSGVGRPVLILGFGHHLVPNSNPPTTDEARQRFVNYATAAALSVAPQRPIFEMWNEYNLGARRNPDFNVENYVALAKAVQPAVKRAVPSAPFVVGVLGDDPGFKWTDALLKTDLLKIADGISIHIYNHCAAPAGRIAAEAIERLETFQRRVAEATGNANYPVYLTETGWPTGEAKCSVNEQLSADNMAQIILWSSTAPPWLKGIWIYELKDSGTKLTELEHNFGIYHFDNSPKPAVCSIRESWAFIRSSQTAERTKPVPGVVLIRSKSGSETKAALWSENPTKRFEVRLKGTEPNAEVSHLCQQAAGPAPGAWTELSTTPLLVTAKGQAALDFEIRPAN